jgi:iron complex outermembrane receptor protein
MGMRISARIQKKITDNVSNYFVFRLGENSIVKQKILLGLDYAQQVKPIGGANIWTGSNDYLKLDGTVGSFKPENIADFKVDADGNPIPNIPHFNLVNPSYTLAYPSDYILNRRSTAALKYYTTGYYLQNQITINKLQVLLGLRYNSYIDYIKYNTNDEEKIEQNKLIPRLGLVYAITDNLNAYGTYTESFEPQRANFMDEVKGGPFDPLQGNMVEFGLKGEFFSKKLAANIAIYSITQKNELFADPNDLQKLIQIGETSSKGIELDIMGRISQNFSIIANYAYNETTIEYAPEGSGFEAGDTRPNAPKHQGGFFAKYKVSNGFLNGISFNTGANFVSERNSINGPSLKFPSYTVADFGMSYEIDKFALRLTVNNVFDKTHWIGGYNYVRMFPGAPRNYLLSVGYTF